MFMQLVLTVLRLCIYFVDLIGILLAFVWRPSGSR